MRPIAPSFYAGGHADARRVGFLGGSPWSNSINPSLTIESLEWRRGQPHEHIDARLHAYRAFHRARDYWACCWRNTGGERPDSDGQRSIISELRYRDTRRRYSRFKTNTTACREIVPMPQPSSPVKKWQPIIRDTLTQAVTETVIDASTVGLTRAIRD